MGKIVSHWKQTPIQSNFFKSSSSPRMEPKLYEAATCGDLKVLKELQDDILNILQEVTPTGNTALHLAAYHGHVKVVKMLLQLMNQNMEVGMQASRAKNEEGNTAFHEAAIGGQYEVIEVLLEHDYDLVNMINGAGETALFKAAEGGHEKILIKLLPLTSSQYDRRTSDGQTLMECAIYNKHKGVVKKLITAKSSLLQEVDNLGRTPLHNIAYLNGISEIAKLLLEEDKSLCYKVDNNHQSALHIAVKEGNLDLATEILKYAKDYIEIVDNDGKNALHLVIENAVQIFDRVSRHIKTLVLLVMSKRLINKVDNQGKTALDIAMDNMDTDERLFNGIRWLLELNGARRTSKMTMERSENSFTTKMSTWKVQIISINAVLIATVAFAAPFTLPREDNKHHLYSGLFQFTVICDTFTFCSSILSAILLMYALYGKQEDPLLLNTSLTGLWVALISLLLAFGTGICVIMAPNHRLLAAIVLIMVSIVPIFIRMMILRSKKYIFIEDEYHLWTLLIIVVVHNMIPASMWIIYIWIIVSIVGLGWLIGRRRYLRSKEKLYRDDGNFLWFFIWYLIFGIIDAIPLIIPRTKPISVSWFVMGLVAFIGRRIFLKSKEISKSNDHYIWFFSWDLMFGMLAHIYFTLLLLLNV